MTKIIITCLALFTFLSCDNEPKVITSGSDVVQSTGVFPTLSDSVSSKQPSAGKLKGFHKVIVKEILKTGDYVYMYVTEEGKDFWIATSLQDIEIGQTYFYQGGVLQTNFVSKEFDRTFDEIYLVSKVVSADHGGMTKSDLNSNIKEKPIVSNSTRNIVRKDGSVSIKELIDHPQKYSGKQIQITAECTKLSENIMGRNWIHLKDGSKDDFDLIITSNVSVLTGKVVTMKGIVVLNKDFGAGYKYDVILEDGVVIN